MTHRIGEWRAAAELMAEMIARDEWRTVRRACVGCGRRYHGIPGHTGLLCDSCSDPADRCLTAVGTTKPALHYAYCLLTADPETSTPLAPVRISRPSQAWSAIGDLVEAGWKNVRLDGAENEWKRIVVDGFVPPTWPFTVPDFVGGSPGGGKSDDMAKFSAALAEASRASAASTKQLAEMSAAAVNAGISLRAVTANMAAGLVEALAALPRYWGDEDSRRVREPLAKIEDQPTALAEPGPPRRVSVGGLVP